MNEKFIMDVLQLTQMYLRKTQCKRLNGDLHIVLHKFEDLKKK